MFPRQERNYILMELSSPTKDLSRRSSLQDDPPVEKSLLETCKERIESNQSSNLDQDQLQVKLEEMKNDKTEEVQRKGVNEAQEDSNKLVEKSDNVENRTTAEETLEMRINEDETEAQLDAIDGEKSALDTKERSSDNNSDGEWKNREPNWEELGLVDDEVLTDFHNKVSLLFASRFYANDICKISFFS